MILLGVFTAGGVGALCRYFVETLFKQTEIQTGFPWATFWVNCLGCLLAGFLYQQFVLKASGVLTKSQLTVLFVGFLGGFTTFSGYALQVIRLWSEGQKLNLAIQYLILSPVMGLLAVFIGMSLSKKLS